MIDDVLDFCDQYPCPGVNHRFFFEALSSGEKSLIDLRNGGIVGLILDRVYSATGAQPLEIIGQAQDLDAITAGTFLDRAKDRAASAGIPYLELAALPTHWGKQTKILKSLGGKIGYTEYEMTCPAFRPRGAELPRDWTWVDFSLKFLSDYVSLHHAAYKEIPGSYLAEETAIVPHLTEAGHRIRLLYNGSSAVGLVRASSLNGSITKLARHPAYERQGIGNILMDEAARLVGNRALILLVDKNKKGFALAKKYGFFIKSYLDVYRMGTQPHLNGS